MVELISELELVPATIMSEKTKIIYIPTDIFREYVDEERKACLKAYRTYITAFTQRERINAAEDLLAARTIFAKNRGYIKKKEKK